MSTAAHEAAHTAMALTLGRAVTHVEITAGVEWRDEVLGRTMIPLLNGHYDRAAAIRLAGYWGRLHPWPPPYEGAVREDLEELCDVIADLDLDREGYEVLVAEAARMMSDPKFRRLRAAITRLLNVAERIEGPDLERLAAAHGYPVQPEQEQPLCSTY